MKDLDTIIYEGLVGGRSRDVKTLDQVIGSWVDILSRKVPEALQWSRRADIVKSLVEDMKSALGDKDVRDLREGQCDTVRRLKASNEIILATTCSPRGSMIEYMIVSWPTKGINISVHLNGTRKRSIFYKVNALSDIFCISWSGDALRFDLGSGWAVAIGPNATSRKVFEEFVKSLIREVNTVITNDLNGLSVL